MSGTCKCESDRQRAIDCLEEASRFLFEAHLLIRTENEYSQFDYCTSSKLGEATCEVEALCKRISKIVHQK